MYIEFKEGQKHASKNADISDNLDAFIDAGYLIQEEEVVIDIDDKPRSFIEQMIKVFKIETQVVWTARGAHLYFLKGGKFRRSKSVIPLGFDVEYKTSTNTPKGITIKRDGRVREIQNEGKRQIMPNIFMPGNKYIDLYGLSEGDGRNSKIYNHRMQIYNLRNWKQILIFINNYVFADPLNEDEFETVTRDLSIEDTKIEEIFCAEMIMREKQVVKYVQSLWFTEGNEYISSKDRLRRMVYSYCIGKKTSFVDEVINYMDYNCPIFDDEYEFDIKLKNGIIRNCKFYDVKVSEFTPYSINVEYKPDATPVAAVDNYLDNMTGNDQDYKNLFIEMLATTLITKFSTKKALAKFFILVGDGQNGKGTALEIISSIIGRKNTSSLDIEQLVDERYLYHMVGKLANLGDDIIDKPLNEQKMKILKNISTVDEVEIRKLYSQSESVRLTATLIFTSNHILKSFEKGHAFKRRIMWLPMYNRIVKPDPNFISTVTSPEAKEYWLKLMVDGLTRLITNGTFTYSKIVNDFNINYHLENDNCIEYLDCLELSDIVNKTLKEVYEGYDTWCDENGFNPLSKRHLSAKIKESFKVDLMQKKVNGLNRRIYMGTE